MKPKTALQKKVVLLSSELPVISEKQKQYAIDKSFENWGTISRNTIYCLECGGSWKENKACLSDDSRKCPTCKKWLKIKANDKTFKEVEYFGINTVVSGFQVVRIVSCNKYMKKGEKPTYFLSEVIQHFIDKNGINTMLSRKTNGMSGYYDSFIFSSGLEVSGDSRNAYLREEINPFRIYPTQKILPVLKRNGFKNSVHGIAPQKLFKALLTDTTAEYLLKTNQIQILIAYLYGEKNLVDKLLPSVKICTKNGYIIQCYKTWRDYLKLLKEFGKDLRSPKYVCPDDLNKAHNRMVAKSILFQKRTKLEQMKSEIKIAQKQYIKEKKHFFGLQFSDGKITVKVLESVAEFLDEGYTHKHCVFSNEYYSKTDSLVFSASLGDKKLETVEVSLSTMAISQSRGEGNQATKYNAKIVDLVNKNIPKIRQIQLQKAV